MNETQIAQKLAQNIPKDEPVVSAPTVDAPTDAGYVDNMPFDELTKYKLCEQFNIPQHLQSDPAIGEKLSLIYAWASQCSGSEDYLSIVGYMHNVEGLMGYGGTQSKIDKFYQFARLDLQRRNIEREMVYANS